MQIKQKPTNKTKSKQKTKATVFRMQKLLKGGEIVWFVFLKKIEIVLIASFTILLQPSKKQPFKKQPSKN